ncbi:MAG: D-arabinose 5-phosphate isomerase [Thiotrichales bacterium SG8_50]|nr:MAG: D-arabinose 5-phosphate isomerase [Thiotrichales bacterium SG8_50]
MALDQDKVRQIALDVIQTEANAVQALSERIDEAFVKACEIMYACAGRIVVTGMGKSGHVGGKIAATLASTGTPSFFVHPGEASHGDLGMITAVDVVLALSNSGETDEILTILPLIKRLGVPLVTLTGNARSRLAREADVNIDVSVAKEACPLDLAPTSSTTAALAMGDALAITLLESRQFTAEDFARSHPAGRLGKRLLLTVGDLMHSGDALPQVTSSARLSEALVEMTSRGLGMTTVVDDLGHLVGVFTDGDLRRTLDQGPVNVRELPISECMTTKFKWIETSRLAAEAVKMMDEHRINALPVRQGNLVGAVNMHDLLRAGVV